jgi:dTDP-4-dehydrorhamnose 3,5-epimerase
VIFDGNSVYLGALVDLETTPIDGIYVLHRQIRRDSRGFLERIYCQKTLSGVLMNRTIRQINHTLTKGEGTVRGLHFQYPPHAEMKFVSCLRGEIYDVVVDIRRNSPTFLMYYARILSEKNFLSLVVPEGFAHGFQVLSPECEIVYLHTADYEPISEGGINALDKRLSIDWPKTVKNRSERDISHAMLNENFIGLELK